MSQLHRLEDIRTREKSVESFFKICVIRERNYFLELCKLSVDSGQLSVVDAKIVFTDPDLLYLML
jgi:hypothetical protein